MVGFSLQDCELSGNLDSGELGREIHVKTVKKEGFDHESDEFHESKLKRKAGRLVDSSFMRKGNGNAQRSNFVQSIESKEI